MLALKNLNLRPNAAAKPLSRPLALIDRLGLTSDDRILLAVSGGADSMAMAWAFKHWHARNRAAHPLLAMVVDHGLRASSADEACQVKARLIEQGIDAVIGKVSAMNCATKIPKTGVQEWARAMRYRLLVEAAAPENRVIITAHHADDQAETVMMRLEKGSGLAGLGGMGMQAMVSGVRLMRPFLSLTGMELRACLEGSGVEYVDDPSNDNMRFERVRVRKILPHIKGVKQPESPQQSESPQRPESPQQSESPQQPESPKQPESPQQPESPKQSESPQRPESPKQKMPSASESLLRLGSAARGLNGYLHASMMEVMAGRCGMSSYGWGWIECQAFLSLPPLAGRVLLSGFIRAMGGVAYPAGQDALERLRQALISGKDATLGGCEWRYSAARGSIICLREAERLPPAVIVDGEASDGNKCVLFDRWYVYLPQGITGRGTTSRIEALGRLRFANLRKLCKAYQPEKGVPARAFWGLPVLISGGGIDVCDHIILEDGAIIPTLLVDAGDNIVQKRVLPAMRAIACVEFGFLAKADARDSGKMPG